MPYLSIPRFGVAEGHALSKARALLVTISTLGCTTPTAVVNHPVYKAQYETVVVGKTTIEEVRRDFGQPSDVLIGSDGRCEMTWEWAEAQATPITFGASEPKATGLATRVVVRFDARGVVTELLHGGSSIDVVATSWGSRTNKTANFSDLPTDATACRVDQDCTGGLVCGKAHGRDDLPYCMQPSRLVPGLGKVCSSDSECANGLVCRVFAQNATGRCTK